MPLPITIAHRLAEKLTEVRKNGTLAYLRPDGKTQVTIEYDDDDRPVRVDTVVLSSQHAEDIDLDTSSQPDIQKHVVDPVLADFDIASEGYRLLVNPTGKFVVGGPMGDAGPDRPQDHRRHLRRHGPPRRRRVLRQGPVEGRPLRGVRDALGGQERRRRRPGPPLRGPGRLRDRQGPARSVSSSDLRHRRRPRRDDPEGRRSRSSTSARPRSSATSTCSARSTPRPRRTATSAASSRVHLGAHRPRRRAEEGCRRLRPGGRVELPRYLRFLALPVVHTTGSARSHREVCEEISIPWELDAPDHPPTTPRPTHPTGSLPWTSGSASSPSPWPTSTRPGGSTSTGSAGSRRSTCRGRC